MHDTSEMTWHYWFLQEEKRLCPPGVLYEDKLGAYDDPMQAYLLKSEITKDSPSGSHTTSLRLSLLSKKTKNY